MSRLVFLGIGMFVANKVYDVLRDREADREIRANPRVVQLIPSEAISESIDIRSDDATIDSGRAEVVPVQNNKRKYLDGVVDLVTVGNDHVGRYAANVFDRVMKDVRNLVNVLSRASPQLISASSLMIVRLIESFRCMNVDIVEKYMRFADKFDKFVVMTNTLHSVLNAVRQRLLENNDDMTANTMAKIGILCDLMKTRVEEWSSNAFQIIKRRRTIECEPVQIPVDTVERDVEPSIIVRDESDIASHARVRGDHTDFETNRAMTHGIEIVDDIHQTGDVDTLCVIRDDENSIQ
jgi:hypothetical protein